MSNEMYARFSQQILTLDYIQKLEMINILTNSLKSERLSTKEKSAEERIKNISAFKGCMKGLWAKDALEYQKDLREERSLA